MCPIPDLCPFHLRTNQRDEPDSRNYNKLVNWNTAWSIISGVLGRDWISFASFLVPPSMQGSTRRMGVMTDVHRRFLQLLMTHGVLEECDVKRLQKHCYKVHDCEYPALFPGCSAAV